MALNDVEFGLGVAPAESEVSLIGIIGVLSLGLRSLSQVHEMGIQMEGLLLVVSGVRIHESSWLFVLGWDN